MPRRISPTAAAPSPERLTVRAYNVGFGDCFLLTFHYPGFQRRILIDFGSTSPPKNADPGFMEAIAEDIRDQCHDPGGVAKLHAIVATHRHSDHISGFADATSGTGKTIASLEPDVVIQPWTEDPNAQPDASAAAATTYSGGVPDARAFVASLHNMHAVAEAAARESDAPHLGLGVRSREQLRFLGEDNVANRPAVENLMQMGRKTRAAYVHYGSKSGLEELLPGVAVRVLGPPNLEQTQTIRKQRSRDPNEFWQFQSFWRFQAAAGGSTMTGALLFPTAAVYEDDATPANTRWFGSRMQKVRGSQLMELVRTLDKAMNNTSVILLFDVGGTKLLFPGDAQIENWAYALAQEDIRKLLEDVRLYKVGHHGSLNATPKSLWELFAHKSERPAAGRLVAMLSTKPGKHGNTQSKTEVPRRTLVAELGKNSELLSTDNLVKAEICREYTFSFPKRADDAKAKKASGERRAARKAHG